MARNLLLQPTPTSRKNHGLRPVLLGHRDRTFGCTGASRRRKLLALSQRLDHREGQRSGAGYRQGGEVCSNPHFLKTHPPSYWLTSIRNPIISQRPRVTEKKDDKQPHRRQNSEAGLTGAPPDPSSDGRTETNLVQGLRQTTPTSPITS
jgi:hypothetical protein